MSVSPTTHGYLLARDPASQATFLWCPQKSIKIDLPPLGAGTEEDDDLLLECTCVLSDKPTAPDCVVLLFQPSHPFMWYCHVRGLRAKSNRQWVKHEYDIGTYPKWKNKILIGPAAARRGKFYFNSEKTGLGVIDFFSTPPSAPVFGSIANDALSTSYGPAEHVSRRLYLMESNDDLYMVRLEPWIRREDKEASHGAGAGATAVHRMDFPNQRWRKAAHLRGRTFLLSKYYFGASCLDGGKIGLRPDCVYIAWPGRKQMEIYNVKDGSIEVQELDEAPGSNKILWVLPAYLSGK